MNREIKFRAWDKKLKQWASVGFHVFGETTLFNLLQQYCFETSGESSSLDRLLNDIEVTEYTGIKDKNDKEVYEGDIISINKKKEKIISFLDGAFFAGDRRLYQSIANFSEIIGNIYETPQLLRSEPAPQVSDTTRED